MTRQLLRRAELPQGRGEVKAQIVLCYLTHNELHPYATWQQNLDDAGPDGTEGTYWGHYFKTYAEAEEDFKDRAVRLHAKVVKPFNLDVHYALVAEGFHLTQHEADFYDDGDVESGPHLAGGPAYDEYEDADYRIIVDHDGMVAYHEPRDLAMEKYCDEMAERDGMGHRLDGTGEIDGFDSDPHDMKAYHG